MGKHKKQNGSKQKPKVLLNPVMIYLPLVSIICIVSLIVRLKIIAWPAALGAFWKADIVTDFFSYYKSIMIFMLVVMMFCIVCYYMLQGLTAQLMQDKSLYIYYGSAAIIALFAVLSTVFSQYKDIAMWGAPERCEGLFMILAYLVIMLYAMWAYLHKPKFNYIVLALGILTVITGFLGAFQFWGHDLLFTDFGQKLILPEELRTQGLLKKLFEEGKIYGTMYHYNFVGSFGAMIVPLFLTLTLFLKERKQQLFCGVMTIIAVFILLGSTSRAGIVGLAFAAVCFLLFFGQKLMQHYKITLGCAALLVVFVMGINIATGGLALARIPSLLHDVKALVSASDVDFHDEIAVRQIDLQKDSATFTFQTDTMAIQKNATHQPIFTASNGETITASAENSTITIGDNHKVEIQYAVVNEQKTPFLGIYAGDRIEFILALYDDGFTFVDNRMHKINYEEAPSIGFKGKEKLGSSRGYIWSRSLPIFMDSLVLGKGPDTFLVEFPQGDFLGKLYAYDSSREIVDKPHNLYLQIGIQEGGIALVAFLVMMLAYVIDSFRLYALRKEYNPQQIVGVSLALAIIGYLGAGFFNDSIVSIAPIFWILFGIGVAANHLNKKQQNEKSK